MSLLHTPTAPSPRTVHGTAGSLPHTPRTAGHDADRVADQPSRPNTRIDLRDLPAPTVGSISVSGWIDPPVEAIGHDVRSSYVELFWLGVLGPSSTFLMRRLAVGLAHSPEGFQLPIVDTAQSLGLGTPVGRQSPFIRAMHRCCQFRVARWEGDVLQVRRKLPPLRPGQLSRLPESLQAAHAALIERENRARRSTIPPDSQSH